MAPCGSDPIPEGSPVALLANLDVERALHSLTGSRRFAELLIELRRSMRRIEREDLGPEEARQILRGLVPSLRELSKCQDY